jgi:hypothetical protein
MNPEKEGSYMPSSSFNAYSSDTVYSLFGLVSSQANGAKWQVADRPIACPHSIEIERKIGPSGSNANDHVILRARLADSNDETGKISTAVVTLDISIPRDTTAVSSSDVRNLVAEVGSVLRDSSVMEATLSNISNLVSGSDI